MPKNEQMKTAQMNAGFIGLLRQISQSTCLLHLFSVLFLVSIAEISLQYLTINTFRDIAIICITIATTRIWSIKCAELMNNADPNYRHSAPYRWIQHIAEVRLIVSLTLIRYNMMAWISPYDLPSQLVLAAATIFCVALMGTIAISLPSNKC